MILAFDTSNYTTSAATYENGCISNSKIMLEVKSGERGLRQSEALFQHTVNLPRVLEKIDVNNVEAIGVSSKPRNAQGSYMPCFLAGVSAAGAAAKSAGVPIYETSHQVGHILASLYSCNKLDLINEEFFAFHLSGGTTEGLLVCPDDENVIDCRIISQSLDLKAGQAVDRTGVMLDMKFPCGKELDELSKKSTKSYKIKPTIIDSNCSLSGVENKAVKMLSDGEAKEDIAKFVLSYIGFSVSAMLDEMIKAYGKHPVVFSGGVSSNSLLREIINNRYEAYFAEPEFSLDNAAGVAVYAAIKSKQL